MKVSSQKCIIIPVLYKVNVRMCTEKYKRIMLRVPWTARRSNQSILKEIDPEYSLEGLVLNLKFKYLGPPDVKS